MGRSTKETRQRATLPKGGKSPVVKKHVRGKDHQKKQIQLRSLKTTPTLNLLSIRSHGGLTQPELSRITGYSVRAIAGWESGKPLSESARQKIVESNRLLTALGELMPQDQLGLWLRSPNPSFDGQTPMQIIERGESDRLWYMIHQIDDNVAN